MIAVASGAAPLNSAGNQGGLHVKLFYSQTSPYVRKVMVLLHETGQLDDVALEPTSGTPLAPAEGFAARNPLTKVPALERPDGCTLYDSRVICAYLDDRAGAGFTLKAQAGGTL